MGKLLLPVILLLTGLGAGVGAGLVFKPAPSREHTQVEGHEKAPEPGGKAGHDPVEKDNHGAGADVEFVKFNNQFVIPVVAEDKVVSLVVVSLSVEVSTGRREDVYSREPRLRDAFLQVLFDHANMGGFGGAFTSSNNMHVAPHGAAGNRPQGGG